jgi:hypothetical protein
VTGGELIVAFVSGFLLGLMFGLALWGETRL